MRKISFPLVVVAVVAAVLAAALPLTAQRRGQAEAKTAPASDPRQQMIGSVVTATDLSMAGEPGVTVYRYDAAVEEGQPVTADPDASVALDLTPDFLKASDDKIYVPFTVTVEPGAFGSANLAAYLRLAPRGMEAPIDAVAPPVADAKKAKQDRRKRGKEEQDMGPQVVSGVEYPWEDLYELTAAPLTPGGPLAFSRPFSVPAGDYDLYLTVRAREASGEEPVKIAVLKEEITVPDYWGPEFQLSSVLVSRDVTELATIPTGDEQKTRPYVIGNFDIKPNFSGQFSSEDDFSIFFIVYNPTLDAQKQPDVTIEWQPYKKGPLGESKFRSVEAQKLNPQTLPPGFDVAQGHQLVGSLFLPVSAFEPGDYRLAIKVTDNNSGKILEHDVTFVVAAS